MFGRTTRKDQIPVSSYRKAKDVVFLELQHTVFCTECELISYNNAVGCLSCGSVAVLSLARVLGGSLLGEDRAKVLSNAAETINATDRPFLVPPPHRTGALPFEPAYAMATERAGSAVSMYQFGVERTCALTKATGAAVAMSEGSRMVCRGTSGIAPEIGAEVPQDGLTAMCARTGELWRSHDTDSEPWVNRDACRKLGIRSIVVAPVLALRKVIGVLEVFSPSTAAFSDDDAATVQLMASAIALASLRNNQSARTKAEYD